MRSPAHRLLEVTEGGSRGATGLPVLERYRGGRRSVTPLGAEMMAAEIGWEIAMLSRMSRSLLRGRRLSAWMCYTDLPKYR